MAKRAEDMTKEELLEKMRKQNNRYSWKKTCSLTIKEGEDFENKILPENGCENLSQFIKKICRGELIISKKPE